MKRIAYKLLFFITAITFFSCQKLDLVPEGEVSDPSFWNKKEDFQLAANDFYFDLQDAMQYTDANSDIGYGAALGGAAQVPIGNGSFLASANSNDWNVPYALIRGTNYLLQKAGESGLGTEIDRYVGDAYFFRAYSYWRLVKNFGGVPKIDKVLTVESGELYIAKSTQAEIINFIIEDLDAAVAKLPLQSQLTSAELGRVTKGAALALKARAALYQGTWAKFHGEGGDADAYLTQAIDAAEALINSGEYELYNGSGALSYKNLHILPGDDSKEVILAKRYYALRQVHNWTRNLWFNAIVPTKAMADMYLATDGLPIEQSPLFQGYGTMTSEFENRDPRMAQTFVVPGTDITYEGGFLTPTYPAFSGSTTGYVIRKFLGETVQATQFQADYDFKEFRYAETLLILAEALFEKNDMISDGDLDRTVNVIRDRANMPALTNSFVSTNNLDMREEIRRERTVELSFEMFRRDDLRRWKTAETVIPQAIRGVKFVGTEYETAYPDVTVGTDIEVDADGFVVVEPAASRQFLPKHYLFPIPLQQVQLSNQTLTQNPGW